MVYALVAPKVKQPDLSREAAEFAANKIVELEEVENNFPAKESKESKSYSVAIAKTIEENLKQCKKGTKQIEETNEHVFNNHDYRMTSESVDAKNYNLLEFKFHNQIWEEFSAKNASRTKSLD